MKKGPKTKPSSLNELRKTPHFRSRLRQLENAPHAIDSSMERLSRVFTEAFCARDIAEPLLAFDVTTQAASVREILEKRKTGVAGVQIDGRVAGYVLAEDLKDGTIRSFARDFVEVEVVQGSAGMVEIVRGSIEHPYVFVRTFGAIGGVISDEDLQKAPVRMWLFGLVTLIEHRLLESIDNRFPDDSWIGHMSQVRLRKAEDLRAERRRNGFNPRLIDCLQFGDKAKIACGDEQIRSQLGVRSKSRGLETFRALEKLRNNLAHAQEITPADWQFVCDLLDWIDYLLAMLARDPRAAEIRDRLLKLEASR